MKKINVDYIGVVKESDNRKVSYIHEPIENKFHWLIDIMVEMEKNPNMTVLDMQRYIEREFKNSQRGFNYCYPYSYSSSYINWAMLPRSITYQEYQKKLLHASDSVLKKNYLSACTRFIYAFCYYRKLQLLKQDCNNKMFSTETIGWTGYTYEINQDIKIEVNTNFGYGMSSYFFVKLKYKDIDILPYSMMVYYYKANMADIIRYTRMYDIVRESWNIALDFVVKTSNEAITDSSIFVQKWIINEINAMMSGLNRFADNPIIAFNDIMISKELSNLISVRNISMSEKQLYTVYSDEMVIAKQAEKISGALELLNNLKSLSEIFPKIADNIQTIKELNARLLPSFEQKIVEIKKEIERRRNDVDALNFKAETLERECKPHFEKIFEIKKQKEKETGKHVSEHIIREEYFKEHKDFKSNVDKLAILKERIEEQKNDISNREEFAFQIDRCVKLIKYKLQLSA